MKAYLLAAGKGTRLRPLTNQIPKCLAPVCGKPLLEYWLDLFELYGISDVLINTSHLAEDVRDYVQRHSRGIRFTCTYEKTLLGSGGTVKKNWDFVRDEEIFLICYADNLTNINLMKLIDFHKERETEFTLALLKVTNPRECGIVEIDNSSTVVSFMEKPDRPESDLAFAGIMVSGQKLHEFFPEHDVFDLGHDVLPELVRHASGYVMSDYLLDIGTPEKLKQAESDIRNKVM